VSKLVQKPPHTSTEDAPDWELDQEPADAPGDGGPEEAANFIAETVADLAQVAARHKLNMLCYLLSMTQLEAEELIQTFARKKLS
jgi:hypothetical protein